MFLFSLGGLYFSHLPFPLRGQWGPACLNLAQSVSLSHSVSPNLGQMGERHLGSGWVRKSSHVRGSPPTWLGCGDPLSWSSPERCVGNISFPFLLILVPIHTGARVPNLHPSPLTSRPSLPGDNRDRCFSYWLFFFFLAQLKGPPLG